MVEEGKNAWLEEEEEEVVAEAHLVEKRQYQDLNKMVAFTNVLETFKEAEPVPLKAAGLVALVLVTTGEANAGNLKTWILIFM